MTMLPRAWPRNSRRKILINHVFLKCSGEAFWSTIFSRRISNNWSPWMCFVTKSFKPLESYEPGPTLAWACFFSYVFWRVLGGSHLYRVFQSLHASSTLSLARSSAQKSDSWKNIINMEHLSRVCNVLEHSWIYDVLHHQYRQNIYMNSTCRGATRNQKMAKNIGQFG